LSSTFLLSLIFGNIVYTYKYLILFFQIPYLGKDLSVISIVIFVKYIIIKDTMILKRLDKLLCHWHSCCSLSLSLVSL